MKRIIFTSIMALCVVGLWGQLKVDNTGKLKIANTGTAPLAQVHIGTTGESSSFIVERTDGMFMRAVGSSAGSAFTFDETGFFAMFPAPNLTFDGDGSSIAKIFAITGAGNIGMGTLSPAAGAKLDVVGSIFHNGLIIHSDKRLKNNIKKYTNGLDAVMNVDPVTYRYNGKGNTVAGSVHIGLIAQELQKFAPEYVKESVHTEYMLTDGVSGTKEKISEESYLVIKDNEIKYLLWNAVRDQQAIIEDQNKRIDNLETLINDISSASGRVENRIELIEFDKGQLAQNKPNPFHGSTKIDYIIPNSAKSAEMTIFDFQGRLMKTVKLDHVGEGTLNIDASTLSSGSYSYQLIVDGRNIGNHKMIIQN